jgi:hypothetical protein
MPSRYLPGSCAHSLNRLLKFLSHRLRVQVIHPLGVNTADWMAFEAVVRAPMQEPSFTLCRHRIGSQARHVSGSGETVATAAHRPSSSVNHPPCAQGSDLQLTRQGMLYPCLPHRSSPFCRRSQPTPYPSPLCATLAPPKLGRSTGILPSGC